MKTNKIILLVTLGVLVFGILSMGFVKSDGIYNKEKYEECIKNIEVEKEITTSVDALENEKNDYKKQMQICEEKYLTEENTEDEESEKQCVADEDCEFGIHCLDGVCMYRDDGMLIEDEPINETEEVSIIHEHHTGGGCNRGWDCSEWNFDKSFQYRTCEYKCGGKFKQQERPVEVYYMGRIVHYFNEIAVDVKLEGKLE